MKAIKNIIRLSAISLTIITMSGLFTSCSVLASTLLDTAAQSAVEAPAYIQQKKQNIRLNKIQNY